MTATAMRQLLLMLMLAILAGAIALAIFNFDQIKTQAAIFNHASDLTSQKSNHSGPITRAEKIVAEFNYKGDTSRLKSDITMIADQAKVDTPKIQVEGDRVNLTFDKDQDYKNLINFIHSLENSPHAISIESVNIERANSPGKVHVSSIELAIDRSAR